MCDGHLFPTFPSDLLLTLLGEQHTVSASCGRRTRFHVSRKSCKISTAATWSTTFQCSDRSRPASYKIRCASTEVRRSSHIWTGNPLFFASSSANFRVFSVWLLLPPVRRSGFPTTISWQPYLLTSRINERKSDPGSFRISVKTGCAVSPSSSEIATPMRRLPTSSPSMRGAAST